MLRSCRTLCIGQLQRDALSVHAMASALHIHHVHGGRANELGHKAVGRAGVNLCRRAELLHEAVFHDGDTITQCHGFNLVVRHIDRGGFGALVQLLDLGAHFHAQLGVQVGQRFVKQKQFGVSR